MSRWNEDSDTEQIASQRTDASNLRYRASVDSVDVSQSGGHDVFEDEVRQNSSRTRQGHSVQQGLGMSAPQLTLPSWRCIYTCRRFLCLKPEYVVVQKQRPARHCCVGSILLLLLVAAAVCSIALGYHSIVGSVSSIAWVIQETINPTERITLNLNTNDLNEGRSCKWVRGRRWQCRECDSHGDCYTLRRRGQCHPFRRQEWDDPPRFQSHFDPTSISDTDIRSLTKFGIGSVSKVSFDQPMCTTLSSCFDLGRCNDTILTIYTNVTTTAGRPHDELLDYALNHSKRNVVRVHDYQDACLVLVTSGIYHSAKELHNAMHWNDGRNNLLWESARLFHGTLWDAPFSTFSFGHAALASGTLTRAHLRLGYDLTLPLERKWGRPTAPENVHIHRPRKWLLSFRGSIQDSLHPYYQHRWLAAEYWEDATDVVVDVQCKHGNLLGGGKKVTYKPYQLDASSYDDMLWNSTFGFSPGGSAVGSYRFGEILSTGGIPVVTQDFVPPLYPEVDWSNCLVVVSEARIVDLPRLLRDYSREEIKQRQDACWQLLQNVVGDKQAGKSAVWRGDPRVVFTRAMEVWAIRISNALQRQHDLASLNLQVMKPTT